MATFDFLHTPPHTRSPSTVSHLDAAPAQTLSQISESDEITSSDKENFPSHVVVKANTNAGLNQASKDVFAVSPAKQHMSFTPRREKPPPRAWERRPATPFASRTEGQKIWKRVPLAELGIEINQQLSRREEKDLENYVRVVKRMKVNGYMENGNESPHLSSFLGTKWEEESIEKGGSPKKKIRTDSIGVLSTSGEKSLINQEITCKDAPTEAQVDAACSVDAQRTDSVSSVTQPDICPADEEDTAVKEQGSNEISQDQEADSSSGPQIGDVSIEDQSNLQHTSLFEEDGVQNECTSLNFSHQGIVEDASTSELQTVDATTILSLAAPNESTINSENDHQDLHMDKLASKESSSDEPNNNVPKPLDSDACAYETMSSTSALTLTALTTSDHDETAFLRDFLHRAQASKAARIAISPQKRLPPPQSTDENEQLCPESPIQENLETIEENEDDDLSPPIETAHVQQVFEVADTKFTSPTRRGTRASTRTIHSRLPRSQTSNIPPAPHFGPVLPSQNVSSLPNTIQLKRATGCEFIFNAKEQQTLAMMTRANTKKNQGGAIHVGQRLAQLKKELDALQQNEQSMMKEVDTGEILYNAEDGENKTVDVKYALKKRKRDRHDEGKAEKVRRNVRWPSNEQLVRYREASPLRENESLLEGGSSPIDPDTAIALAQRSAESTAIPETNTVSAVADADEKPKDTTEELSKLKVRRIRKVKHDSVNGTPAPKTRSRTLIETESDEVDPEVFTANASETTSKTKTRRSSRMPVPVATPIPLPSFSAAAKPKARRTEKESVGNPRKTNTHTEGNVEAQSTQSDRRSDGRRNLRTKRG